VITSLQRNKAHFTEVDGFAYIWSNCIRAGSIPELKESASRGILQSR
jgi:hypothetical protein